MQRRTCRHLWRVPPAVQHQVGADREAVGFNVLARAPPPAAPEEARGPEEAAKGDVVLTSVQGAAPAAKAEAEAEAQPEAPKGSVGVGAPRRRAARASWVHVEEEEAAPASREP